MADRGQSEGFHVLDEFACDAIPSAAVPREKPTSLGRNDGMAVTTDIVIDAPGDDTPTDAGSGRIEAA